MKTIYLIAGVSGSGKSWVLDNVRLDVTKLKSDNIPNLKDLVLAINNAQSDVVIVEKTTLVSTLIKQLPTHKVQLLIVSGDFLKIKQQLITRGGKVTPGLYRRWKRMKALTKLYSAIVGNSSEIKKWLENTTKNNLVYNFIAPANAIAPTHSIKKQKDKKKTLTIKEARSTEEQRKLTSELSTKRYADPVKRDEMAIACGGKQFEVYKDGVLIGTWTNAAQCAKDLNFATKTHISNCLHGRRNSYLKHTFKYS
jgi:hypothetical protein